MNNMRKNKFVVLLLISLLIMTLFVGCTSNNQSNVKEPKENSNEVSKSAVEYPLEIEDQFGNKLVFEKAPEKIVSLAPSHTEILFSLGLGDNLVGVTSFCDYPEEAKTKEQVGSFKEINIERIIELEPDMVFQYGPGDESINNNLKEAGIKVISYEPETIDEVINLIKTVGMITNKTEEAEKVTKEMIDKKNSIVEKTKDVEKVKVFYEIWHDPLTAAGPGSFMDELITLAGGDNIAKDADSPYPQFDVEKLIERDPEVYLAAADMEERSPESIKQRPGYESITAIKNDKIYSLEPNIVSRPGPRIVEALELVAKAIHPELFK
ncbi:iron complex transport system substrate-binding protein [Keratinibaculum paraultunense]|uniref:Iron complex transport system substrate-binding protein n=1 Tax=Keratinibaculum paraultunense TaxID=1278232 RepID=A0A4R3KXU2_9FIRM|nr:cobalamin-binding protein [Keratinibaculum paraultunense]QQY80257.1 cobalamin-binding protein [Keratinibaculum paraultunense]TCS90770.1 iron complex transport system substrate-binding protein [Keratinibaculum paraultunense]